MGRFQQGLAAFRAGILAAALALALTPAGAQETDEGEASQVETPDIAAEPVPEAPYDERLERLSRQYLGMEPIGAKHEVAAADIAGLSAGRQQP